MEINLGPINFNFNLNVIFQTQIITVAKVNFSSSTVIQAIMSYAESKESNKEIEILSVSLRIFKDNMESLIEVIKFAALKDCTIKIVVASSQDEIFKKLHPRDEQFNSSQCIKKLHNGLKKLSYEARKSIFIYEHHFAIYSSTYRIGSVLIVVPHVFKKVSAVDTNIYYHKQSNTNEFNLYTQQFTDIISDKEATSEINLLE